MTRKKGLIVFLVIAILFSIGAINVSAKGFGGRSKTEQIRRADVSERPGNFRRVMRGMMRHKRDLREEVDSMFAEKQAALNALVDEYTAAGKLMESEADLLKVTGCELAKSRFDLIEKLFSEGDLGNLERAILKGYRMRSEDDRETLLATLVNEDILTADEAELLLKTPNEVREERADLVEHLVSTGKLSEEEAEKLQIVCREDVGRFKRAFDVARGRFGGPCFFAESTDDQTDAGDD